MREKYLNKKFFLVSYFPVIGLNTDIYTVNICNQFKFGKIRTRKNSAFGLFLHSGGGTYHLGDTSNLSEITFIPNLYEKNVPPERDIFHSG